MFVPSSSSFSVKCKLLLWSTLACVFVTGSASAQTLPAPAPVPGTSKDSGTTPPVTVVPESMPPSSGDIIELEPPVRHSTPTPRPTSRPSTAPTPRPVAQRRSVGGIAINGLSDAAAVQKLKRALSPKLGDTVKLSDGKSEYSVRRAALGASIPYAALVAQAKQTGGDIPLRFTVDTRKAQAAIRGLAPKINRSGGAASLDVEAGKVVVRGAESVTLAVPGSAWRVKQALEAQPPRTKVELVVQRGSSGAPGGLSQFRYVLASFSTPYDASLRGRTNNLRMAARNVNGTIVPNGKTFSTNRAIGPRNAAAGWREAKMFVGGAVVDGVGAGICQSSTTIYNAALLAGLPIVERHPHSFRVNYAPASRDAAIYWGHKDMRFRNDTGGPIYVQTFVQGGRFHARLFGVAPSRHKVEVESRTLSQTKGTRSEAYRVIHTPTGSKRQLLSRDYYKPKPQ